MYSLRSTHARHSHLYNELRFFSVSTRVNNEYLWVSRNRRYDMVQKALGIPYREAFQKIKDHIENSPTKQEMLKMLLSDPEDLYALMIRDKVITDLVLDLVKINKNYLESTIWWWSYYLYYSLT